jgi:hypothetical protein
MWQHIWLLQILCYPRKLYQKKVLLTPTNLVHKVHQISLSLQSRNHLCLLALVAESSMQVRKPRCKTLLVHFLLPEFLCSSFNWCGAHMHIPGADPQTRYDMIQCQGGLWWHQSHQCGVQTPVGCPPSPDSTQSMILVSWSSISSHLQSACPLSLLEIGNTVPKVPESATKHGWMFFSNSLLHSKTVGKP